MVLRGQLRGRVGRCREFYICSRRGFLEPDSSIRLFFVTDYQKLYKKLERTLNAIEEAPDVAATVRSLLARILASFGEELGLSAGRFYHLYGDRYVLSQVEGDGAHPEGFSLPLDYVPVARVRSEGYVLMRHTDPGIRHDIEAALRVDHFAAICFGQKREYIISFTLDAKHDPEQVLYSLNAVRHVCDLKLRQSRMERVMTEAREIQESLIRDPPSSFAGFTIAARTRPADAVGGDVYVFIPVSQHILGFAVADVAGHGLGAALQARDVSVGLRMGISENLKMVSTIDRLNRVIHETSLASKFVTLFYGELEGNGNLIYVNAGHLPGLVLPAAGGAPTALRKGGMVLGPNPASRYQRGFHELSPGDMLVIHSDGIVEAETPAGESYGDDRMLAVIRRLAGQPPADIITAVLEDVDTFCQGAPQVDDQTLVLVRRD